MKQIKIVVVGMGPVGVVTATTFAEHGYQVVGVDIAPNLITSLSRGELHFFEPGLEELLRQTIDSGCLSFTDSPTIPFQESDIIFITVGTPFQNGKLDVSGVERVVETILEAVPPHSRKIIAIRSTVTPGTNERIREVVGRRKHEHAIVSVPEFFSEGNALRAAKYPDRIIVATLDKWALPTMHVLFEPFLRLSQTPFIDDIDPASAEFTKVFANCMLALRISAMNEFACLIDGAETGANIENVRRGIGTDPRIGLAFLYPGIGFGGSCFPKDVAGLVALAKEYGIDTPIIEAILKINEKQKRRLFTSATKHFVRDNFHGLVFAVWGIAFKDGTSDTRESPGVELVWQLVSASATVVVYDPHINTQDLANLNFPEERVRLVTQPYDALQGVSALFVTTPYRGWRTFDYERAMAAMHERVIFDGRNLYDPSEMAERGFFCYSIGRPVGIPKM